MRTDQLIAALAAHPAPPPRSALHRRMATGLLWGLGGTALLLLAVFGLRADLSRHLHEPMLWGKLAFAAALAGMALWALGRLARPGMAMGWAPLGLALPPVALWLVALYVLWPAGDAERAAMLMGSTSRSCAFNIGLLSLPPLAALFWVLKGAAPTRLAWSGAGAGRLAGALGTLAYGLHCSEMQAPFLAVWYVAGIALPTLLGALLGPRLLRW